ncbi:RNA polymerase sigma-I factor [Halalkalibacter kiskunsagensis]|uniref:RNA polymerase sigma factor SigI n=1 Tax=Halalkalibacter kiskunsagensis TaxID=1548599 RepID=A0ABV6KGT0_9BACI
MQQYLKQAMMGDELARERLILHYKPYMINVAGHVTKKFISWSDEEASIALLAFNRAIDTFDEAGGRRFLSYAYLLINRDLVDFYRKEKRENHLSLDRSLDEEESLSNKQENEKSLKEYEQQVQSAELVEEILELDQTLRQYKIKFEELEDYSPKHEDTRLALFEMAATFSKDAECVELLQRKKKLPIKLISKKLGYKKKTLERHRKYLITLILLTLHPQWEKLSQFIKRES